MGQWRLSQVRRRREVQSNLCTTVTLGNSKVIAIYRVIAKYRSTFQKI